MAGVEGSAGFRRGWFISFTGHADGAEESFVRLNGEFFESDLCIGHDGGGLLADGAVALGRGIVGVVSAQNHPMVISFLLTINIGTSLRLDLSTGLQ